MHTVLVVYALIARESELPAIAGNAIRQVHDGFGSLGVLGLAVVFFRAYSMGAGTYTGIEAVSNGLPILREPKAVTGKRTMIYMAVSLAFIAGGILIAYLLEGVEPHQGQTLNAVLFEKLTAQWSVGGLNLGPWVVTFTLVTEGALLFVAAQTGFVGGPQVLATMAVDRWVPRRFASLSERLVTQDGVLAMGLAAAVILFQTHAEVSVLVVLYAINVFVTFTLSQLGMSRLWWNARATEPKWIRKLLVNGVGCLFTATILCLTVTLKFNQGGWMTDGDDRRRGRRLLPGPPPLRARQARDRTARSGGVAANLQRPGKRSGTARSRPAHRGPDGQRVQRTRTCDAHQHREPLPESVSQRRLHLRGRGRLGALQRPRGTQQLEAGITDDLQEYCRLAADLGFHAELRAAIGTDVVLELRGLCFEVAREFRHSVFFAGQLVFGDDLNGFMSRFLHNHTALDLLQSLQMHG